jgi:hypothetical protein
VTISLAPIILAIFPIKDSQKDSSLSGGGGKLGEGGGTKALSRIRIVSVYSTLHYPSSAPTPTPGCMADISKPYSLKTKTTMGNYFFFYFPILFYKKKKKKKKKKSKIV